MDWQIAGRTTRQIVDSVEEGVQVGALHPGDDLPSVRALAAQQAVSTATVATAYRLLRLRGVVVARPGSGTAIAGRPALATLAQVTHVHPQLHDLSQANPDAALLPELGPALRAISTEHTLYGAAPLEARFAELCRRWFADLVVERAADEYGLCVTGGALDAVERVLRSRCRIGDEVGVEDPSYAGVLDLVRGMGLRPVGIELDDEGPIPTSVERLLGRTVQTMIITPRAQNPTGAAISARRAATLRRLLRGRPSLHVIENDYFSELAGVPHHWLSPRRESWTVIRSTSKLLGPDLRVAALVGDPRTVGRVRGTQQLGTAWVSHLVQRLVVALWDDSATTALLARARETYDRRRHRLIEDLAVRGVTGRGRTGFNVVVGVPEESQIAQSLAALGWQVRSGERHRLTSDPFIRITTATLTAEHSVRLADDIAARLTPIGRNPSP